MASDRESVQAFFYESCREREFVKFLIYAYCVISISFIRKVPLPVIVCVCLSLLELKYIVQFFLRSKLLLLLSSRIHSAYFYELLGLIFVVSLASVTSFIFH
jgi:hypothetical protein